MTSTSTPSSRSTSRGPVSQETFIVGISGPSSSGKTTLARLLRTIFSPETAERDGVNAFIIHEDDFYKPDDEIPVTTTQRGMPIRDWDTVDALNVPQMLSTLSYVSRHGKLPANLKSKEDLNDATDSGVGDDTIRKLRGAISGRLARVLCARRGNDNGNDNPGDGISFSVSLAFVDGFLLYAPPGDENHPLARVGKYIDVPLFLPATYKLLKERREGRSGYVTIGPAPTPVVKDQGENKDESGDSADDLDGDEHQDDEDGYDPPTQNFWTDPPGYVDDIVWPRYIEDHAWLLVPESETQRAMDKDVSVLKDLVGEGDNVREDMGVIIAPGKGRAPMVELLEWAVEEVITRVERGV